MYVIYPWLPFARKCTIPCCFQTFTFMSLIACKVKLCCDISLVILLHSQRIPTPTTYIAGRQGRRAHTSIAFLYITLAGSYSGRRLTQTSSRPVEVECLSYVQSGKSRAPVA